MGATHTNGSETCNNSVTVRESHGVRCQTVSMTGTAANPVSHFGRQLKKERLARGWSLPELSRRTGIDAGHLSRMENGKRPPPEAIALACDAAFPERRGGLSEYYEESRHWSEVPASFKSWPEYEDKAATL